MEKRGANTDWVAKQLAHRANISSRDVGYAGLKDRNAVTRQWFSLLTSTLTPDDVSAWEDAEFTVLKAVRHRKKLQRGGLSGNFLSITVREPHGSRAAWEDRVQLIAEQGVPNYFGPQRFGHGGQNITKAQALFDQPKRKIKRHQRGLYLSAARAFLFNAVLMQRVHEGTWNRALSGDQLIFDGSQSFFPFAAEPEVLRRVASLELHPSGPLFGTEDSISNDVSKHIEDEVIQHHASLYAGLQHWGLRTERRALRLRVDALTFSYPTAEQIKINFRLNKGTFASTVLGELFS